MTQSIGEIIEVTTAAFVAQSIVMPDDGRLALCEPPAFGSFVKLGEVVASDATLPAAAPIDGVDEVDPFSTPHRRPTAPDRPLGPNLMFALVCYAQTSSLAPGRRPTALRMSSEDQMREQYPQIFELLTTEFSGMLIGYTDNDGKIRRYLPPRPPRIHSHVRACAAWEIEAITSNLSFLRFVLAAGQGMGGVQVPTDSLVSATIRHAMVARGNDLEFVESAGRTLLPLLGDDYQRLQGIIESALDGVL